MTQASAGARRAERQAEREREPPWTDRDVMDLTLKERTEIVLKHVGSGVVKKPWTVKDVKKGKWPWRGYYTSRLTTLKFVGVTPPKGYVQSVKESMSFGGLVVGPPQLIGMTPVHMIMDASERSALCVEHSPDLHQGGYPPYTPPKTWMLERHAHVDSEQVVTVFKHAWRSDLPEASHVCITKGFLAIYPSLCAPVSIRTEGLYLENMNFFEHLCAERMHEVYGQRLYDSTGMFHGRAFQLTDEDERYAQLVKMSGHNRSPPNMLKIMGGPFQHVLDVQRFGSPRPEFEIGIFELVAERAKPVIHMLVPFCPDVEAEVGPPSTALHVKTPLSDENLTNLPTFRSVRQTLFRRDWVLLKTDDRAAALVFAILEWSKNERIWMPVSLVKTILGFVP